MNWSRAQGYLRSVAARGIHPGLDRMRALMARLDRPETRFKAVHVTGTNGKGSVCAVLESVARESGVRTALYTSPHLTDLSERMRVCGEPVGHRELAGLIDEVRRRAGRLEPGLTYFEFVTAVAFLLFARRRVELAVVEVGLGGRLDATNVLPPPELCVITNIDLEHQAYLGNTVRKIAREKAGILKRGTVCVTGASGEALEVIRRTASKVGARVVAAAGSGKGLPDLSLDAAVRASALKGSFQRDNLRLVLSSVAELRRGGWPFDHRALKAGLRLASWPGRFDRRSFRVGGRIVPLLLDGAHNPAAVRRLEQALRDEAFARRPATLVFNALKDKNVPEMVRILRESVGVREVLIPALDTARGSDPRETRKLFGERSRTFPSVRSLWADLKKSRPAPEWILATGSLYLIGETLAAFSRSNRSPQEA